MKTIEERTFSVLTNTYVSKFEYISPHVLRMQRMHSFPRPNINFDVFSRLWAWGIGNLPEKKIFAKRSHQLVELSGPILIIIPPFSVTEWFIEQTQLEWTGYFTDLPYPDGLPSETTVFQWSAKVAPLTAIELLQATKTCEHKTVIGRRGRASSVADRTKKYIDLNFESQQSVAEIANHLKYSHSVMTRMFRAEFGISPIVYRNRLRVFEALKYILFENHDILSASLKVGFASQSRFSKQFREFSNTAPSQFRPPPTSEIKTDYGSVPTVLSSRTEIDLNA